MRILVMAIVFLGLIGGGAHAAQVTERTNCADVSASIATLESKGDLSDDDTDELARLRALHRRDCATRAGARSARTIAKTRMMPAPVSSGTGTDSAADTATTTPAVVTISIADDDAPAVADSCTNPDANGCCPGEESVDFGDEGIMCCVDDMCYPPMKVATEQSTTQSTTQSATDNAAAQPETAVDYRAQGLCDDGSAPNKYGCCDGYMFKALADGNFACCVKNTDNCVDAIKTK